MKALLKLDKHTPQGFTTAGSTMFFSGPLTIRQVIAVFNRFPITACLECSNGYYLREDFAECQHDPNCLASKAMAAVKESCKGVMPI